MILAFLTSPESKPMAFWASIGAVVTVGAHVALQLLPTRLAPLLSANTALAAAVLGSLVGAYLWWQRHPTAAADAVHLARVTRHAMDGDGHASAELERLTAARRAGLRALAETSRSAERRLLRDLSAEYAGLGQLLNEPQVRCDPALQQQLATDRALLEAEIAAIKNRKGLIRATTDA